ncbi:uncharacterized protein LOC121363808 [Pyrgilauda ruficollis]|uniref:uncharacterized protein LOC121363808 n=1 Tax=Pyrgilauda ruficollis TaxID=221976 RepID=UPI001B87C6B5|nr:uncharacterized protein LOC121363808 [Pyrgilauda ruficollis]
MLPLAPLTLGSSFWFLLPVTLVEKPKTPRHGENQPASPLSSNGKTQGKGKEENASSDTVSTGENDMGQNGGRSGMGRRGMGWGMGQKDTRRNMQWGDTGQNDTEQKDMGRSGRWSNRGQNGVGQDDLGQNDMGQKGMGRNVRWSDREWSDMGQDDMGQDDMGQDDMEQIKNEETEIDISEVEALPSSLDIPPEVTNMGEIKEEETKMSISKKKDLDGSFTTSEMHPRAPGTPVPVQRVQSVRGHPGSQNLWIPADSTAGPSSGSRLPASKEEHGGGGVRMEPYPAEAGL